MPITCYAYDPIEQQHTYPGHPEHRGRLATTMQLLRKDGILERMLAVPVTPIAAEQLHRVHPPTYVHQVEQMAAFGPNHLDPDTYVVPGSYEAALASAGALINVVGAVMRGDARNGMSLMRPPGHHALPARGMGFCIFANAALAARSAQQDFGAQRVLIVDWDVHHGNGTEAIFYDDPSVAFFSIHQYPYYPGSGAATDIGDGPGRGYTFNVPFPAGVGDKGYVRAFDELLAPFARRFQPDLILLSAGYDAHWDDPLAMELLSIEGYAALARRLVRLAETLCGGRLVATLEGGYHLDVLAHAVLTTLRIFENPDAPVSDPFGPSPYEEKDVSSLLAHLQEIHKIQG
ncbi:MAG: histone deacetylase [Chloroflexi bacterium]|nr:histone deacetylase [Chloroflexota bacterium]